MMVPLGATSSVIDVARIRRWRDTEAPVYDIMVDDPSNMRQSPFKWNDSINSKLSLWAGDLVQLNTEAIVHSTNESLSDKTQLNEHLLQKAGPDLRRDIKNNIKSCKTGEAKLSKGYRLSARYVIHTVGPRYNVKYRTAAESALYNSYRNVLLLVRENHIASLGLCCIHSMKRGYPSVEGAHIAIRTVRRFLEKYGEDVEKVVLVVTGEDEEVYLSLLTLYFPRSPSEEEFAAYHLPYDVGNEDGEPIIPERQIRISAGKPGKLQETENHPLEGHRGGLEDSVNISEAFETSVAVGAHSFAKMESDFDRQRKHKLQGTTQIESEWHQRNERYTRWLKRAKMADLTEISSLRCLYQSGFDKYGRPVVVFVGKNFPATEVNLEKAILYFIHLMDSIVDKNYVVVYLYTMTSKDNHPDTSFIKDIYSLVDYRYRKNLSAFYIVHPTVWSKVLTWWFTTFSLTELKPRVHNIPGLEYLYSRIPPDQLDLPPFILEHDLRVHGTRYYDPDEDEAIGAL